MKKIYFLIAFLLIVIASFATHQRAGEITYKYKGGLTYEITILTYTYAPSLADRPQLLVNWGDGTKSDLNRIDSTYLGNDIMKNVYVGDHSYNGLGEYLISVEDPNRNYGIMNIPNSVNVPFFVQSLLIINPFFTPNNSPQLLLPPIDNGCTNVPYIHNPGAYDVDGDSLSYKLVTCRGAGGLYVPGYVLPNQVGNNAGTLISLDPLTGTFEWISPKTQGEYNIAILIEEWRNGMRIGYVIRDMQIIIDACNNHPPEIKPIPDTCVIAGDSVQFLVEATDPDGNKITLTGTGGPLVMANSPATFFQPAMGTGAVSSMFTWHTNCGHVRKSPYQVYFKAVDNGYPISLVDIATVNITVIAPPVQSLSVTPYANSMKLLWSVSPCSNAIGYRIYRRNGFYGYIPAHCETGVPAYTGYVKIAEIQGLNNLAFTDDENGSGLIHGVDYCYMIIAYFGDGAESIASDEVCATLKRDLPIITNVSVTNTGIPDGVLDIRWMKPTELDSVQTPGPYKYFIYRALPSNSTYALIDSIDGLTDTSYVDNQINSKDNKIAYRIGLLNNTEGNRFMIGSSQPATSVYLNVSATDEKLILSWSFSVPWTNDTFVVYRQNPLNLVFDSIGYSTTKTYIDSGLVNGTNYCYKVKSLGSYSAPGFPKQLINWSQFQCGSPVDNVAPCAPKLTVDLICDLVENQLHWTNPDNICCDDVMKYNIYYTPVLNGDFTLLATVVGATDTSFLHINLLSIAACYFVTAVDFNDNESIYSNVVCVDIDSCPTYQLPNVFTPNGDNKNDFFHPFPYTSVESIDLQIFNRWGKIVFKTQDPQILWDGKNINSNQDAPEGVYYYVCDVFEKRLQGLTKRTLSGVIHLLR